MKRLAKILVPTDLSEHSRRALLYDLPKNFLRRERW